MKCTEVSALLDAGLCINVGRTPANNIDHLLFWSEADGSFFVALRDALNGKIVTVLPEHFHARSSWKTSAEDQAKARELALSQPRLDLRRPRFPMVTAGPQRPVKDRVECPICKARAGELCFNDWGKPTYRVHIERLAAYRELRWREGLANNQPPKKKAVTASQESQSKFNCTIKVWRMVRSGQMATDVVATESAAEFGGDIEQLLAEPAFSERLARNLESKGIPFESVFKVIVVCKKLETTRIIEYPEHEARRNALRLKMLMDRDPEDETEAATDEDAADEYVEAAPSVLEAISD